MVFSSLAKLVLFPFKLLKWLVLWCIGCLLLSFIFSAPVEGLEAEQRTAIVQNCSTIKRSLNQLQRVDSRTRTYLGTTYETLSNRFIVPLNLRLVNNGRPTLGSIQPDFTIAHLEFRNRYTDYMREFDTLVNTDCRAHPDEFYSRLERVREKRTDLRTATNRLNALAHEQYSATQKLRDSL